MRNWQHCSSTGKGASNQQPITSNCCVSSTKIALMRANYGIDAPGVIRNLLLVTAGGLLIWGTAAAGLWSSVLGNAHVRINIAQTVIWPAIACGLMAAWMLWHSTVGKVRGREALLDQLTWTGGEQVLDIGCVRGLMLIGAAKRLTTGTATGVDIWQSE